MKHTSAAFLIALAPSLLANERYEYAKTEPGNDAFFYGFKLDLNGNRLAVGARETPGSGPGRVYVYERNGLRWRETASFTAAESVYGDRFGDGVALQDDLMVVGASGRDDLDTDAGAAYVFELDGTNWVERTKLPHNSGFIDGFGSAIAIDGDTIVVGGDRGTRVHVYRGAGSTWSTEVVLDTPGLGSGDFGYSVALDGDRLVVGAPSDGTSSDRQGAAYVYDRIGSTWSLTQTLTATPYLNNNYFGRAVDVEDDRIVVTTLNPFYPNYTYVFELGATGWDMEARFLPPASTDQDYFGETASLEGDLIAVGSRSSNLGPHDAGVVNWFFLDASGWTHGGHLVATDPRGDSFLGWGLDMQGRTVVAGAWGADAVYAFDLGGARERGYCTSVPNSSGAAATISSTGSKSIMLNDFTLVAENCPPSTGALFVYSSEPGRAPLGDGSLCLDPTAGVFPLLPVLRTDAGGRVQRLADVQMLPVGEVLPGTSWYFQCLFRDPAAGGSGLNSTDGLEVSFCP